MDTKGQTVGSSGIKWLASLKFMLGDFPEIFRHVNWIIAVYHLSKQVRRPRIVNDSSCSFPIFRQRSPTSHCRVASRPAEQKNASVPFHQPGVTTQDIDDVVFTQTTQAGAYPSPLAYRGFPKSVCTSVNNVVCHGIPDSRPLQTGDIVNIDVTVRTVVCLSVGRWDCQYLDFTVTSLQLCDCQWDGGTLSCCHVTSTV